MNQEAARRMTPPNPQTSDPLAETWRYTPHTYAQHASGGLWQCYPYLRYVGNRIAEAVRRGHGRLMISCPPRHGKSQLVSHWTPVWYLDNLPHKRVILASYGEALASDFGREVRNEFERNPCCRARLRQDSQSAGRWNTPQGGGMVVAGVGGPISGRGGDVMIIDDPTKNWQDAHSQQVKGMVWDWYHSTFYTRAEPGATIIVAMTRWTEDDLCGRLLAENTDRWEVISLPALAEAGDILGRAEGEALCPQRFPVKDLENTRRAVGGPVWEALYQQRPSAFSQGRVYENFSAANIDNTVGLQPDLPLHLAMDFNTNPGMHVVIGQYDNQADLFTAVDEIHGPRMNTVAACRTFKRWLEARGWKQGGRLPWPEVHVFGDATGNTGSLATSESCYDIVRRCLDLWLLPHCMRYPRANPPVRERIDTVNDALCDVEGHIHVKIHPQCVRLITDLKNVKSDAAGLLDKRDHALSHASDALGYQIHFLRPLWRRSSLKVVGGRFNV